MKKYLISRGHEFEMRRHSERRSGTFAKPIERSRVLVWNLSKRTVNMFTPGWIHDYQLELEMVKREKHSRIDR